jgi:hypothetical protein
MSKYSSYWGDDDDYTSEYDSYGSYGYGGRSNKKETKYSSYSWKPSVWTNYSWGGSIYDEDDNSDLFVKDPITYLTPTKADIKAKSNVWIDKSVDTIKELARVCYFKMVDEREYISEKFADYDSLSEGQQMDYEQKKQLYDGIFDQFIPGNTPLEQAIAIYRQIGGNSEYRKRNPTGDEEDEDIDYDSTLNFDRAIYSDPDINQQLEFNELSKERKMDILDKISIVGQLGDQFKVEKEVEEKLVSNSDQYAKKIMRDYAQFSNIELYQKMFPNFRTKFLTKDLTVNVPVDRKEQKQKIIILLDFSGSMDSCDKQTWVNAILIDRLRYVMKEEAEVYFSYFVHNPKNMQFHHLKNREDVMDFWTWFSNDPNGGTTDIGAMVTSIANDISNRKLGNLSVDLSVEKPEILVINDGQDRVGYDTLPYKVNAISLMDFSSELKTLCIKTGGKQVRVGYDNSVTSYAEEGTTVIDDGKNTKTS